MNAELDRAHCHDGGGGGQCVHGVHLELHDEENENGDGAESEGNELPLLGSHVWEVKEVGSR